jgi:hypothetical protein
MCTFVVELMSFISFYFFIFFLLKKQKDDMYWMMKLQKNLAMTND